MKLHWKQIALGVLTDWIVTILLFAVCFVILAIPQIQNSGIETLDKNMPSGINSYLAVFIGFISTVAGGYVAFGTNRDDCWKNIVAFATISVLLTVILRFNVKANMPSSFVIAGFVLNIPAALLGGLWRWRNLSQDRVLKVASPLPEVPRK